LQQGRQRLGMMVSVNDVWGRPDLPDVAKHGNALGPDLFRYQSHDR
jgi:hypothetical protein